MEQGRAGSVVKTKKNPQPNNKKGQLTGTKYAELEYRQNRDKTRKAKHNF